MSDDEDSTTEVSAFGAADPLQEPRWPPVSAEPPGGPSSGPSTGPPSGPPVPPSAPPTPMHPTAVAPPPMFAPTAPAPEPQSYPGFAAGQAYGTGTTFRTSRVRLVLAIAVTAFVAGAGGVGAGVWIADDDKPTTVAAPSPTAPPTASAPPSTPPVAQVAADAMRGIVVVHTDAGNTQEAFGSGFLWDERGHIVTNAHVIDSADPENLTVQRPDGKLLPVELVGTAQEYDLAVLKVSDTAGLSPLPLGESAKVRSGDPVIAIGAPLGLTRTVTVGIISATQRALPGEDDSVVAMDSLQTDAALNPGNSGGPLLDAQGRVIGINSSTARTSPGSEAGFPGVGFALPVDPVRWMVDTLVRTGRPAYAQLGVVPDEDILDPGSPIAQSPRGGSDPVTPGGPADLAGLRPGDIIIRLGDRPILNNLDLAAALWAQHPGDKVTVAYVRDGAENTTSVTLGERVGDD